jgi:hypothetical protein
MDFDCQSLPDQRWGIYQKAKLLATARCPLMAQVMVAVLQDRIATDLLFLEDEDPQIPIVPIRDEASEQEQARWGIYRDLNLLASVETAEMCELIVNTLQNRLQSTSAGAESPLVLHPLKCQQCEQSSGSESESEPAS